METTVELTVEDNGLIKAVSTYPDGRKHTMWHPSMESYLAEQRFWKAADHKRFMAVIWNKEITMEEALAQIDKHEQDRPSVN